MEKGIEMNIMTPEENLSARANLFKALGHPMRLLIMNLVKMKPRHGEELALILNISQATVSHHLAKLSEVGLIEARKDQYYQTYSLTGQVLKQTVEDVISIPQAGLSAQVEEDAYRHKVLKTFVKHGRIIQIPAQLKKKLVLLEHILNEFEPGVTYTEMQVNRILLEFNEDVAQLRRDLVDYGYMERASGIYRRTAKSEEQSE